VQQVADEHDTMPEMRLELVPVPVADVDRAKAFYQQAGFELGVDSQMSDTMRVVQFTPPGSACTIVFGTGMPGISDMQPGSVHGLHLVVDDIDEARQALPTTGAAAWVAANRRDRWNRCCRRTRRRSCGWATPS
jgi:hypothetical protein